MSNFEKAEWNAQGGDLAHAQAYATLALADEVRELKDKVALLGATFLAIEMASMTEDERKVVDLVIDGLVAKMEKGS